MNRLVSTELDSSSYPHWRDAILEAEASGAATPRPPRCYPGYPTWPLLRCRKRWWPSLDSALARRRSVPELTTTVPSRKAISRLLERSHGITGDTNFGPVPSAGGLQALELYALTFEDAWLPRGLYHYDRRGHHLAQMQPDTERDDWAQFIPSLERFAGGGVVWFIVGDGARVRAKYAERGLRFLLLEAGHLMQNLCLVSASLGLVTVPLGGFFERELAQRMELLGTDHLLYVGVCGEPHHG